MRVLALVIASVVLGFGMKGDGDGTSQMAGANSSEGRTGVAEATLVAAIRAGRAAVDGDDGQERDDPQVALRPTEAALDGLGMQLPGRAADTAAGGGGSPLLPMRAELVNPGVPRLTIRQLARTITETPEPPPLPTVVPTPEPTVLARQQGIPDLICSYSWPCGQALAIVYGPTPRCPNGESGGDPNAYNRQPVVIGGVENHAEGLFQMLIPLHSWRFDGSPYDAGANIRAAYSLWSETRSFRAWSC